MMTRELLLERIETVCRERGIAESTFGRLAVNDGKLVARLRAGRTVTIETWAAIERALEQPAPRLTPQPEEARDVA